MSLTVRRLVACVSILACLQSTSIKANPGDPSPDSDPNDIPPQDRHGVVPNYPRDAILPTDAPLVIPGVAGVTDTGQATYSVPLWVPDGPMGMKPQLSIEYNGTGNGALGAGMGIAGLSVISPCNATYAAEGAPDGIDYDRSDVYCLDGQKLVFESIVDDHDRLFRTESASGTRIIARYDDASDERPKKFTVRTSDGQELTYDAQFATRLRGLSGQEMEFDESPYAKIAVVYPIAHAVDRTGAHEIEYVYEQDPAHEPLELAYRIAEIRWSFVHGTPRRKLQFLYEAEQRPDPIVTYVSGVQIANRSRLRAIEALAPNPDVVAPVWRYNFEYDVSSDTFRSRLHSIQLCDAANHCSWHKTFGWTHAGPGIADEHVVSDAIEFDDESLSQDFLGFVEYTTAPNANFLAPTDVRLMVFDANSDGMDDVLYRTAPTRHVPDQKYYKHLDSVEVSTTYEKGALFLRTSYEDQPLDFRTELSGPLEPTPWQVHLGKSRVADFDFDGDVDLLLARTRYDAIGTWYEPGEEPQVPNGIGLESYDRWTFGYTYFTSFPWIWWDVNVNGALHEEVMTGPVFRHAIPGPSWTYHQFVPSFQRALADLDGDGRIDQVDAIQLGPNDPANPVGATQDLIDHIGEDWFDPNVPHHVTPGAGYPYRFMRADGTPPGMFPFDWTCNNGNLVVTDIDADGRSDILAAADDEIDPNASVASTGLYHQLRFDDDYFIPSANGLSMLQSGNCSDWQPDLVLGDWNGDGLEDALYPPQSYGDNQTPLVRWNLGNGFGPLDDTFWIEGGPGFNELLNQRVPEGQDGLPVGWDRGTRTADVNGDGRTDIVAFRLEAENCVEPNENFGCDALRTAVAVYLSAGDHFEAQILDVWENSGVSLSEGFTTAQLGDVTGDGSVDLVHVVDGKIDVVELGWREPSDRLKSVTDIDGGFWAEEFEYTRAWWGDGPRPAATTCHYPTSCSTRGFPVVRRHTSFAGTDSAGIAMTRTRTHRYVGPRVDLTGRGFLGFAEHYIWDRELGRETKIEYDLAAPQQDFTPGSAGGLFYPAAQMPKSVRVITPRELVATVDDGTSMTPGLDGMTQVDARVSIVTRTYEASAALGGRVLDVKPASYQVSELDTVALRTDDGATNSTPGYDTWYGSSFPSITRSVTGSFEFDEYGFPTYEEHKTQDGVTRIVKHEYENRDDLASGEWILGLETETSVTSFDPDATLPPGDQHPYRITRTTYDLHGLQETLATSAMKGTNPTLCVIDDPTSCEDAGTTTEFVRDPATGNVTAVTSSAANEPLTRSTWFDWDSEGVYRTRVTDGLGFQHTTLLHPAFGTPILDIDELGVVTQMQYDGFGRFRHSARPGLPELDRYYSVFDSPARGLIATDLGTDGSRSSTTYDELGRAIASARLGFDGSSWIMSAQEYDAIGNLRLAHRPDFGAPSAYAVTFTHDRLGRLRSREGADGAMTVTDYTTYTSTTTDAEGHVNYVELDADGRPVETGHTVDGIPYGQLYMQYGPFDVVEHVIDANGNSTDTEYDTFGRRILVYDPDAGATEYAWNGFGELLIETAANGDAYTFAYDELGRIEHTVGPENDTAYTWNSQGRLGKISSNGMDEVTTAYEYDMLGRPTVVGHTIGGVDYEIERTYDQFGRIDRLLYPEVSGQDRFSIRYEYNTSGYLRRISDVTSCDPDPNGPNICIALPLWHVNARNADLMVESGDFGNGRSLFHDYDLTNGRLQQVWVPGLSYMMSYGYFDDGNVESRTNGLTGDSETFAYDPLHRLTDQSWLSTKDGPNIEAPAVKYAYDELGNLHGADVGGQPVFAAHFDDPSHPHQMTSSNAGGDFKYDGRGRQEDSASRSITWSQFDLPRQIETSDGLITDFEYDASGGRVRRSVKNGSDDPETIYVGGIYEHRTAGVDESDVFLVGGDEGLVAQVAYESDGSVSYRYLATDPLGSATLVMDDNGGEVEQSIYDPWGLRVDAEGKAVDDPDPATTMGFTGHEHDDDGLINMHGRIYDRSAYRFLTPDPVIQAPLFGQSHNPYSYALNNPLRRADPSGFDTSDLAGDGDTSSLPKMEHPETVVIGCPEPLTPACGGAGPASSAGIFSDSRLFASGSYSHLGAWSRAAQVVGYAIEHGSRIGASHMRGIVDAIDGVNRFRFPGFLGANRVFAIVEAVDEFGAMHYIVGVNGANPLTSALGDVRHVLPDVILAEAGGAGVHAEIAALQAAERRGLTAVRLAASKALCDGCADIANAIDGVDVLTPTRAQNGGKITRQLTPNATALVDEVRTISKLRSVARTLGPALTVAGATLGALSLYEHVSTGNYVDAVLGDASGLVGSAIGASGGNPFVAGGLGAFSAGYGITMSLLETFGDGYLNRPHFEPANDP